MSRLHRTGILLRDYEIGSLTVGYHWRITYRQEMGKIYARTYGKRLREIGLTNAWFAILEGMTIASGATKDEVERILQCILPTGRRKFVYIFRLKEK